MNLIKRIQILGSLVVVTFGTVIVLYFSSPSLRARGIKPSFFTNDRLVDLDPLIRLLFIGTWQASDRRGLLEDRPMKLKIQILPADDCDVDEFLYQLQDAGFVIRYHEKKAPEKRYIKIIKFPDHQNPHRDEKVNPNIPEFDPKKHGISTRPAGCQQGADTVPAPSQHQSNPADSYNLTPDSLTPDSLTFVNGTEPSTKEGISRVFNKGEKVFSLATLLRDLILSNRPAAKVPSATAEGLAHWCHDIDLLLRIDGRDPVEVERVIRWCQADSFWKSNILSPSKLRKQYDQLALKMQVGDNGGKPAVEKPGLETKEGKGIW